MAELVVNLIFAATHLVAKCLWDTAIDTIDEKFHAKARAEAQDREQALVRKKLEEIYELNKLLALCQKFRQLENPNNLSGFTGGAYSSYIITWHCTIMRFKTTICNITSKK